MMGEANNAALLSPQFFSGSLGALRGEQMRRLAGKNPAQLAAEFEALLLAETIKAMRQTVPSSSFLPQSLHHGVYDGLFDMEMARSMVKGGGLGLAKELAVAIGRLDDKGITSINPPMSALSGAAGYSVSGNLQAVATRRLHGGVEKGAGAPGAREGNPSEGAGGPLKATQATTAIAQNSILGATLASARLPVAGKVSSGFGLRFDPIDGKRSFHHGIDLAAPAGSPITAVAAGTVTFSGVHPRGGNVVIVSHNQDVSTLYAHARVLLVHEGQKVATGQLLGRVGESGRATGPHLHFELKFRGQAIDPTVVLETTATRQAALLESQDSYTKG